MPHGGSEFKDNSSCKKDCNDKKDPFGGGSGAGVSINPVAFLVIQDKNVKLISVKHDTPMDKVLDYVPDVIEKIGGFMKKNDESDGKDM